MVAKVFQVIFWALLILVVANLIFLDMKFFQKLDSVKPQPPAPEEPIIEETASPAAEIDVCPAACLEKIDEIIQATAPPSVQKQPVVAAQGVKEFFVSFGSGSTTAREWLEMIGLETYIDSSQYGSIKEVVFEASLNIPNGNQRGYARLFNVTDGHMVWNSEVSLEGGTPGLVISSPLTLSPGKKLYRVQMKTTVGDVAILTQSRIKITTQ